MTESPDVSIVLPVYNELDSIGFVVREIAATMRGAKRAFEILAVDDGSTDGTAGLLTVLAGEIPELRVFRLEPNAGQSAAFGTGFRHARGALVVTMDADGQSDPADIPRLLEHLVSHDMCCGYRAQRRDRLSKVVASRIANAIRRALLDDGVIDTGCSLKAMRRELAVALPMFRGMHRFMPALARMRGATIHQIAMNHRRRYAGRSKYSNFGRLKVTVADLLAVRWMKKRSPLFAVTEKKPHHE